MSYGVEIGSIGDPQQLFTQLCHEIDISTHYFILVDKSDICWSWQIKPEYQQIYLDKRDHIKNILADWIAHQKVKYASW